MNRVLLRVTPSSVGSSVLPETAYDSYSSTVYARPYPSGGQTWVKDLPAAHHEFLAQQGAPAAGG
jgi:hypothetical protein